MRAPGAAPSGAGRSVLLRSAKNRSEHRPALFLVPASMLFTSLYTKNPDIQTAPAFCIQVAKRGRRAQQTKVTGAGARTLCKLCSCFVLPFFGISPWRLTFLSDFIFSKQKARLTGRRAHNLDGVFA